MHLRSKQALSAAVVLIVLAGGCGDPHGPAARTVLRRGLGGEPSTLIPGEADDTFSTTLILDLFEGLTSESPAGDVVPAVARAWSLDPSGTTYTFELRGDARWSNGIPIKATDFVAAWRRNVDPRTGSPTADEFRLVANASEILAGRAPPSALGVSAPNDSTLVVQLEHPAAYFPQILAHPGTFPVFSASSVKAHQADLWVSNGAYVLSERQPGASIHLKANPAYWDRAHVAIANVTYLFKPDEAAQYAGYRAGEIDVTDIVPANALPQLRNANSHELVIAPFLATAYYGLNLSNKTLSPSALRRALAMAIDRKRLVESLGFGQVPAYGLVPPGTANYSPQTWEWKDLGDDERIETATRLYALAGFSVKKPLHLRLLYNNNEVIRRTAIIVAAMWKEVLGIEVELTSEEYKVFLQTRHDLARWDVVRLAWNADFNDASNFLDVLRAHSPNNDMSYDNPAVDAALDTAANTVELPARARELEQAERLVLNDYPIIPVYYFVSKRLVKPYVHGVHPNPLNHLPSKWLTLSQ